MKKYCPPIISLILVILMIGSLSFTKPAAAKVSAPTITIATPSEPTSMDLTTSLNFRTDLPILCNVYDCLIAKDDNGKPLPTGGLASYTISDDNLTITFTLRQGIKFSNGDPLTTKDVLFTHERSVAKKATYAGLFKNLDRVEVVDDYIIKFIWKVPDIQFLPLAVIQYGWIHSKTYFDRVGEKEFSKNPIGTGPYKVVKWVRGQYIDLAANENYWGAKPKIKKARLLFAKEGTTRVAMLQSGEVDIIVDTPIPDLKPLKQAGFQTSTISPAGCIGVQFDTLNSSVPWADKRVREAIMCAISPTYIINTLFQGVPQYYPWLVPTDLGYDPNLKGYDYDVARAKKLMAEAGYGDGFDLELYFGTMFGPETKDVVDAVASYLKAININCIITALDGVAILESQVKAHSDPTAKMVLVSWGVSGTGQPDPVIGINRMFHSQSRFSLYSNPKMDALIDEGLKTLDNAKRAELIMQMNQILYEDVPYGQIMVTTANFALKTNIDFKPTKIGFSLIQIQNMSFK